MKEIDVCIYEEYTGTMESLESMVKKLNLESNEYHFNIITKTFYNSKDGIIYSPGDHFQYRVYKMEDN